MTGDIVEFPTPEPQPVTQGATALDAAVPTGERRPQSTPPSGRRISRAERRQHQRQRIEGAAASVFAREGLHGASVEQILQSAGVSRSTFYRYFSNLDDVLLAVKRTAAQLFGDAVEQSVLACPKSPEKIRVAIRTYLDLVGRYGDFARVLHRELPGTAASSAGIRAATLRRMAQLFRTSLEEAKEQGYILSIPEDVTIRALVFAIEGVACEYLESYDEERAVDAAPGLIDLCYRTFGA